MSGSMQSACLRGVGVAPDVRFPSREVESDARGAERLLLVFLSGAPSRNIVRAQTGDRKKKGVFASFLKKKRLISVIF
jgi:hypothetical protein